MRFQRGQGVTNYKDWLYGNEDSIIASKQMEPLLDEHNHTCPYVVHLLHHVKRTLGCIQCQAEPTIQIC